MPVVDLSNIGLEGQQAFATRMATLAQGRQMEAVAEEKELANQETELMNDLNAQASAKLRSLARGERGTPSVDTEGAVRNMDSLASPLEVTADIYARFGAPGKAAEMLKEASTIRKQEADIEDGEVLRENRRLDNIIKGGDLVSKTLGIARNQSEWEHGIERIRQQGIMPPEQIDQIAAIPFSPDAAAYFNEQAISAADRARNDLTRMGQERQERQSAAARAQEERKITLQARRDIDQEKHRAWERKNGGKNAASAITPSERDVTSARALLLAGPFRDSKYNEKRGDPDIDAAAEYVASQAKSILQNNKAITWDTAVQQAIIRGQQDGTLSVDPAKNEWFRELPFAGGKVPAKPKFNQVEGKTVDAPAALPKTAAEMKKGNYYVTSKGIVQWDGTKGIPVND